MNKGILGQVCQIMLQTETTGDRFNSPVSTNVVVFDEVQCNMDTLMDARVGVTNAPGMSAIRGGGLLTIDGDYGFGKDRLFNEKNFIRLEGFDYYIDFVHDIHTPSGLDHYEIELIRRVAGGTP